MIQNVFRAEGLPLDLAYIPIIESGFKTNAVSKANAKGPWQFMKATALENGLKHDWYHRRAVGSREGHGGRREVPEDARQDVRRRLEPGARRLQRRASAGVQRAMNALGHGRLLGAVRQSSRYLPRETREYVPLILAAIIVAKNPAQYRLRRRRGASRSRTRRSRCRAPSTCVASPSGPARRIDEIQALNPELRRWTTPVKIEGLRAEGAAGTGEHVSGAARVALARGSGRAQVVHGRNGEIARDHRPQAAASAAPTLRKPTTCRSSRAFAAGQELIIPRAPATLLAARTERAGAVEVASRAARRAEPPYRTAPAHASSTHRRTA